MNIPNKHEAFDKVRKSIQSCNTSIQLNAAEHLMRNFSRMFNDLVYDLTLIDLSYDKLSEIIESHNVKKSTK